jgi:hypothetical protein
MSDRLNTVATRENRAGCVNILRIVPSGITPVGSVCSSVEGAILLETSAKRVASRLCLDHFVPQTTYFRPQAGHYIAREAGFAEVPIAALSGSPGGCPTPEAVADCKILWKTKAFMIFGTDNG